MAKKIKKRPNVSETPVDPQLEEVGEDRAFEIEYDEELDEVLLVHHYRRKWKDDFDADIEHGFNLVECRAMVSTLLNIMQYMEQVAKAKQATPLIEKSTPDIIEKNPLKDNPVQ